MKRGVLLALGTPLVAALVLYGGCSSEESNQVGAGLAGVGNGAASGGSAAAGGAAAGGNSGTGGQGASASGGQTAGGTGQGGGAIGPDAGFDADFGYDAPEFDSSLNPDSACVDESIAAEPVPLDIYFMLDESGSMDDGGSDCNVTWPGAPTSNCKWCYAINAIAGYIQDATSEGNRAAIEFFSGGDACNGSENVVPAQGFVNLTGQANLIVTAMNGASPGGMTPTEGALRGLTQFTAANQTPGRIVIGILITDGDPTECNQTNSTLGGIVQTHFNNTGIHTFIIGMDGATFSNLESWADYTGAIQHDDTYDSCGNGAGPCYHYNVGNGDPDVFIWALQQIQNAVLGCTFILPEPQQGVLDPEQVKVEYLPGGVEPGQELTRVNDASQCVADGWYYDDNTTPTLIQLCPAMCTTVQADASAEVQILLGCQGS